MGRCIGLWNTVQSHLAGSAHLQDCFWRVYRRNLELGIWDLEAARESTVAENAVQHYWLLKRQLRKFQSNHQICKAIETTAIDDTLIWKYFQIDLRSKPVFLWNSAWFKLLFWARLFKNKEVKLIEVTPKQVKPRYNWTLLSNWSENPNSVLKMALFISDSILSSLVNLPQ